MIRTDTELALDKQSARLTGKIDALVNTTLIDALYTASQAGVEIKPNVRGTCSLKPGVPGPSENIEFVSIIDRFLEHARIFAFDHGGERTRVYLLRRLDAAESRTPAGTVERERSTMFEPHRPGE